MGDRDITQINEKVKKESQFIEAIMLEMQKVIVGQRYLLERLLIGLLANGHVLLEGVPGLAKTLAVKTLASTMNGTSRYPISSSRGSSSANPKKKSNNSRTLNPNRRVPPAPTATLISV